VSRRMGEVIGFDRPVHLAVDRIGEGGIPEPPTPPIARADMNSTSRAMRREAHEGHSRK
jgi:hypothetical protein